MNKRVLLLFLALTLLPLVSAEIFIGQTQSLYNVGDDFSMEIKLAPTADTSAFFTAKLACGSNSLEIHKSPYMIKGGTEKEITIAPTFDKFVVGENLRGDCYIEAEFGNDIKRSQLFEISSDIKVSLNINDALFEPGEKVSIIGTARKSNDEVLDGFVELNIDGIDFQFSGPVENGEFNVSFYIPSDSPAGSFPLIARAYEKDYAEQIINEGNGTSSIKIKQIMKTLEISINPPTFAPPIDSIFTVFLYDQSGAQISEDISIIISNPSGEIFEKKIVRSGKENSFHSESNYAPGYWKIESEISDIKAEESFYIEEVHKISYALINKTLIVTNTGNSKYEKPLEVIIGGISEVIDLSLDVGKTAKFKLSAPNGEYKIEVANGKETEELGSTFLTGNAVSVGEISDTLISKFYLLILAILILIGIVIGVYFYRKKRFSPKLPKHVEETKTAQSTNVINRGQKQDSVVISLKIKNYDSVNKPKSEALASIDSALWKAKESGAKVYSHNEYRIIVLSQILTKEKDNCVRATIIAQTIERILTGHNKRSSQKIDFGIGVNSGELIVESNGGRFKFISVGNTIVLAKKLSSDAKLDVLISSALHHKTIGKISVDKISETSWKLKKVTDRTQHQDYVNKFKSRQKK